MYKLYGIPNCDTVKKARVFLDKRKVVYEFIDFKKTPPTQELIERWSEAFKGPPVNPKGVTYKKFKGEFEGLSVRKKAAFLCEHSSMIKRPILEKNNKTMAFGFDEADYAQQLGT